MRFAKLILGMSAVVTYFAACCQTINTKLIDAVLVGLAKSRRRSGGGPIRLLEAAVANMQGG
jgi:hypothetical protein